MKVRAFVSRYDQTMKLQKFKHLMALPEVMRSTPDTFNQMYAVNHNEAFYMLGGLGSIVRALLANPFEVRGIDLSNLDIVKLDKFLLGPSGMAGQQWNVVVSDYRAKSPKVVILPRETGGITRPASSANIAAAILAYRQRQKADQMTGSAAALLAINPNSGAFQATSSSMFRAGVANDPRWNKVDLSELEDEGSSSSSSSSSWRAGKKP